jgi:thiol-disulfide isomerase/thioredoxin
MKNILSFLLLALVATTGWAQKKVWNDIVTGYASAPIIKVTKVAFYDDRTEVFLRLEVPQRMAGQSVPIAAKPILKADGKEYAVKEATVIKLNEPYAIPADGKVDFSLVFEPIQANTWMIDVAEPNAWSIANIRDADSQPTGIADTYWRIEATGDWLIGFAKQHVIYNNKVLDIVSQIEKKDAYTLTLNDGTTIHVGKIKNGLRQIAIGKNKAIVCSPITGAALPDYPTKDQRTGFVDNGYKATDSVTIIGWLKDMPAQAWQKGKEFNIGFQNIITVQQENAFAKMDSLGRFTLRMPLLNSSQVFLDWGRTTESTMLEPGKTYFFLNDFKTGQMLWMGDDVRLQNELLVHPHDWNNDRLEHEDAGKVSAMQFKAKTDSNRAASLARLEETIQKNPNLSQRYIDFVKGYYLASQGESMMQARFSMPNFELPQEYMDYTGRELWRKVAKPYTLYRDFSSFMRDYLDQIISKRPRNSADETLAIIRQLEQQGVVTLTSEENEALKVYLPMLKELEAKLSVPQNSEKIDELVSAFNHDETVQKVYALFNRVGEPLRNEMAAMSLRENLAVIDSVGCDQALRDIYLARCLYLQIDNTHQPLEPALLAYAEKNIQLTSALNTVKALNDKYVAIQNMDVSQLVKLHKGNDVANMTDGEKMLRKICEPYKGKIILLDVWGTWCGPCKELLSHSQEEYERLKDYDLVYLYLANRSSDESWKNVIKEYNIVGENVVHYNLPNDQQSAIEHFLNVQTFPTYKLIDREGNVLDIDVNAHDLEGLARLLEKL